MYTISIRLISNLRKWKKYGQLLEWRESAYFSLGEVSLKLFQYIYSGGIQDLSHGFEFSKHSMNFQSEIFRSPKISQKVDKKYSRNLSKLVYRIG